MSHDCENCKANPVEIARATPGTPTAKLIAILMAHGITDNAQLAEATGLTPRAVQIARATHFAKPASPSETHFAEAKPISRNPFRLAKPISLGTELAPARAQMESLSEIVISERESIIGARKKKSKAARGARLPAEWVLPKSWGEWAQINTTFDREGILVEAEKFRDFWVSKSGAGATKLDWQATWRNWCRNANSRRPYNPQRMAHDERKARLAAEGKPTTLREALNRRIAEQAAMEATA